MDGSRIKKYDARQLFTWASVAVFLLLLGVQFFAFGGDGAASARTPVEVRGAREKLRSLDEARQALARIGTVNLAAIPDRDYAAIDPAALVAEAEASTDADSLESDSSLAVAAVAPAVIESPPPELKGIVQTRDASGQVRLRASYPHRIVTQGENVGEYLVQKITLTSVTLTRNGKSIVQQVADSRLLRRKGE